MIHSRGPLKRSTGFTASFLVAASLASGGCAARQGITGTRWTVVPKELNMQSQGNPTNPRKPAPPVPEMVGATPAPFFIGPGITQISLEMHPPTGPALDHEGGVMHRDIYLAFDNVKGKVRAPSFQVYLNLPPGRQPDEHPELRAGVLAMFGLVESSSPRDNHGGDGKNMIISVTDLFVRLMAARDWDSRTLRVTFVPQTWDAPVPQVQVGRVALYFR